VPPGAKTIEVHQPRENRPVGPGVVPFERALKPAPAILARLEAEGPPAFRPETRLNHGPSSCTPVTVCHPRGAGSHRGGAGPRCLGGGGERRGVGRTMASTTLDNPGAPRSSSGPREPRRGTAGITWVLAHHNDGNEKACKVPGNSAISSSGPRTGRSPGPPILCFFRSS